MKPLNNIVEDHVQCKQALILSSAILGRSRKSLRFILLATICNLMDSAKQPGLGALGLHSGIGT